MEMRSSQLEESSAFMQEIGLRFEFKNDAVAIWELRGGTHIVIVGDSSHKPGDADFDLMVEDIDQKYSDFRAGNFEVSKMKRGEIHDSFYVTEPVGNRILVNSTHVRDHRLV